MRNLKNRLKNLEAVTTKCPVPASERLVVVYEKDDQAAMVAAHVAKLRAQYGTKVSETDLFVIRVVYESNAKVPL